jgi:monoamine oxidase
MARQAPDFQAIARDGLQPAGGRPKEVIIVGAGMAGLVAAHELLRAGHDPIILEAQHRVGGRVQTIRDPFAPGLYAEAGAMRIPRSHSLTLAYVEKFNLPVVPFAMSNPRAFYHLQGRLIRIAEADADPTQLTPGVGDREADQTVARLWTAALQPIASKLETGGESAWSEIAAQYDAYSVREFLELNNWQEEAIELFGLLWNQEALMNSSFMELLREEVGGFYTDMLQIEGGMDRLPRALLPALGDRIRFSARMTAIDQTPEEVIVHYRTPAGRAQVRGDYAIITVPFSVLRHVETLKPFSRAKQRAIRQLHYDASAKIFFQCRRRFWRMMRGLSAGGPSPIYLFVTFTIPSTAGTPGVECSLPATRGQRMRTAGDRWPLRSASHRPWRTSLKSIPKSWKPSNLVPRRCGTTTSLPEGRSRCSTPASRHCCTRPSSLPRGASTSPGSTPPSRTPGSRARSSLACGPRRRCIMLPEGEREGEDSPAEVRQVLVSR